MRERSLVVSGVIAGMLLCLALIYHPFASNSYIYLARKGGGDASRDLPPVGVANSGPESTDARVHVPDKPSFGDITSVPPFVPVTVAAQTASPRVRITPLRARRNVLPARSHHLRCPGPPSSGLRPCRDKPAGL
jgi:hypothetical protein